MSCLPRFLSWCHLLLVIGGLLISLTAAAQVGGAFTYQGELQDEGQPADGNYDFEFRLFSQESGGTAWAGNVQSRTLAVADGVFTTELDFPAGPFDGSNRWLEIRVRPAGGGSFVTLAPRQRITPSPYAVHASSVAAGAITDAQLAEGAVTATAVDASSIQLRVSGQCAAGSSIRRIFEDGTVTCEPDDAGGGGLWMTGTDGGILSTLPATIETNSSPSLPTLSLVETQDDFVRLRFRNTVNTARHWTLATGIAATQSSDRFNFFNPAVGDVLSLTGDGWVGAGTSAPVAPFAVQSDGFWRPESGNGFGDFHIGTGIVGLSVGIATGGGGAGTAHIWTQGGQPIFLGNGSSGMLLGIGTNGSNITLLNQTHEGPGNKLLEIEPDGDLVAVGKPTPEPTSLFGQFGGDGSNGDLVIDSFTTFNLGQGTPGEVVRRQYSNLTMNSLSTLRIRAQYAFIAVRGICRFNSDNFIDASGSGMPGAGSSGDGEGFDGLSGRQTTDQCVSGAGGNGGTAVYPGGLGGAAEGLQGGGTDPLKRALLAGGVASYPGGSWSTPGVTVTDAFHQLLMCPGGGGGGGGAPVGGIGGSGGDGGGVIYIECNEWVQVGSRRVQILADGTAAGNEQSGGGAKGGGGGGGVALVRVKVGPQFAPLVRAVGSSSNNNANNGQDGYSDYVVLD